MNEVVEQLKVLNDLVKENKDVLKEKYLNNKETYGEFLRKFTEFFASRRMLQLRVSRQYDKILDLIQEGNRKYSNKENDANLAVLLSEITLSSRNYRVNDSDFRDAEESISLYKHYIGLDNLDSQMTYADSIDTVTKVGEKYLEIRNTGAIKDFAKNVYRDIATSNSLDSAKKQVKTNLDDKTRKALELCNNEDFLLFANYTINFSKNADGNFIEDVQNIVNLSRILQTIGLVKDDFKKDNYNKLIEFTNKSLKKYVKDKENHDKAILKKAKRLPQ